MTRAPPSRPSATAHLGIGPLSPQDIESLLRPRRGCRWRSHGGRRRKTSTLRGRTQINLFLRSFHAHPSSFELAGKRLGADGV